MLLKARSKFLLGTRLVMVSRLVVRIMLLLVWSMLDVVFRLKKGFIWLVVTKLLVGTMTRLLLKFKSVTSLARISK